MLRDGKTVLTESTKSLSQIDLVTAMLGRRRKASHRSLSQGRGFDSAVDDQREHGTEVLRASHLSRLPRLVEASLTIKTGKVVGLAGRLGAGRTELARAVFGADPPQSGEVSLSGRHVRFTCPAEAIRARIGFCSEDRQVEGIIPGLSVRENMTLVALPQLSRWFIVSHYRQRQLVQRMIERLGIKIASLDQPIDELSGGNQQKVLLARWLCTLSRLLILDEPTRGIDVGTKDEIRAIVDELAAQGLAVMMISSELDDLIDHCRRIVVMSEGRTVAEFADDPIKVDSILAAMAHGTEVLEMSGD